jgi:spore coat polysaccharide biosynthesis protein SpsF
VKVVATIEARMTSSRLPGKMMLPLGDQPVLGRLIRRLQQAEGLDAIVLATTTNATDDVLAGVAQREGASVFRGSEDDVLGRVCGALDAVAADVCVEITGDCPLVDPVIVSSMIAEFRRTRGENSYVANTTGPQLGVPHGLDVQVFEADALRAIESTVHDTDAREHVSLPFYREPEANPWKPRFVSYFPDAVCRSNWLSLDYPEDYALLRSVHDELGGSGETYDATAMIDACRSRPDMVRACLALRGW